MSPAKTVDAMAIATEATNGHFLAEFSFAAGRLLKITSMRFLRPARPLGAIRVALIVGQPLPVYPDQRTSLDRPFSRSERAQRRIFRALSYGGGGTVSWTHENLIRSSDAHISN